MKKPTIIAVSVGLILVALIGAYLFLPKADTYKSASDTNSPEPTTSVTPETEQNGAASQSATGAYVNYTDKIVASTQGTKVLFFHAPWCPQCRALDASIKAGKIPDGVTIIKVDYDTNQALRQKYGVTTQTTLVQVDDNGKLVKKYVAYDTPSLDALIRNAL